MVQNPWTKFDPEGLTWWDRVEGYAQGVTNGLIGTINFGFSTSLIGQFTTARLPEVHNEGNATDINDFISGENGGSVFFADGSAFVGGAEAKGTEAVVEGGEKILQAGGEDAATAGTKVAESPKPEPSPDPGSKSAAQTTDQASTDAASQTPKGSNNPATRQAQDLGNKVHYDELNGGKGQALPTELSNQYPDTQFRFSRRGEKGADVQVVGGTHPSDYEGSTWQKGNDCGDFKPDTKSGQKTFNRDVRKGKLPSNTQMLPYSSTTGNLN